MPRVTITIDTDTPAFLDHPAKELGRVMFDLRVRLDTLPRGNVRGLHGLVLRDRHDLPVGSVTVSPKPDA